MRKLNVAFRFNKQTSINMKVLSPQKSKLIKNIAKEVSEVKD
jgi:hypothetical protein